MIDNSTTSMPYPQNHQGTTAEVTEPPDIPADLRFWPFDIPFLSRSAPEVDRVAAHSREWVQRMGLVADESDLRRHDRHGMTLFACLNYPSATNEVLELIGDWVSWWAIWSDFPDDEEFLRTEGRAESFFASLSQILSPCPQPSAVAPTDPHVAAFTDIWHRWRQGMSSKFVARTRKNWRDWFDSYLVRCEHRRAGITLGVDEYLSLRDLTGAVRLEMDAIERVGEYEIPCTLLETGPLRVMRLATTRVVNITQDVQSLTKEEAAGDQHNFVLVLQQEEGITREQALRRIHDRIRQYTDSFLAHESEIPRFLDTACLPVEERTPVYRYASDLRALIRGGYDFCSTSGRYQ